MGIDSNAHNIQFAILNQPINRSSSEILKTLPVEDRKARAADGAARQSLFFRIFRGFHGYQSGASS
jgi:hypothetical protein